MAIHYSVRVNLNLYDSPALERLATQAAVGRLLQLVSLQQGRQNDAAIAVQLCEDNYPGWITAQDLRHLVATEASYQAPVLTEAEIAAKVPQVIAFTQQAMAQPNHYLWGGTVAPNYDCSGLMQAAFASVGVWLPRDAYQQEAFVQKIPLVHAGLGDLVFFGSSEKATHVGLCLGEGYYIHSSGKDRGRNGIGIDVLSETGDEISRNYYRQLRGVGRVVASYQPDRVL
jgi:cell wall-associated NlpC family hydrolase